MSSVARPRLGNARKLGRISPARNGQRTLDLFDVYSESTGKTADASSTFVRNMSLPVHAWFRFSAGFSAEWVASLVREFASERANTVLLDPFAGVGTAVLAGEEAGVVSYGLEAQPFIARIAKTKLLWHTPVSEFLAFSQKVLEAARRRNNPIVSYPILMCKCYPEPILRDLHNMKVSWEEAADGSPASELTWLALCAILRACSPVGTAPWQYVLPKKSKAASMEPYDAFRAQTQRMAWDMRYRQDHGVAPLGQIIRSDARECREIGDHLVTLVVTSPPYANNYDYADATRLEMTFFGEVRGWADLHEKARRGLIRSCSQHVSKDRVALEELLAALSETPIANGVGRVCGQLESERLRHGGKKDYHLMIAAYFSDMWSVWKALRRACRRKAKVCFVVGDSAPYGIHVPVERWLGELAIAAGFTSYRFEKLRDRNVKWKNRKHRVPLHEGRLWIEG